MFWLLILGANVLGLTILWRSWVSELPDGGRKLVQIAILASFAAVSTAVPLALKSRQAAMFGLEPVPYTHTDGRLYFEGRPCTDDCSGHLAGWRAAQSIDLDERPYCDDMEYSPSFAEGCRAYIRRANRWWRLI